MRNLKKILALVLALMMVLSVMVTASASFEDAADVQYNEAVEVMAALGILNGYVAEDGTTTFNPKGTLTRAEAAKLIAYVASAGDIAAMGKSETVFDDVPATNWASGYIAYGYANGYINGKSETTFAPKAEITVQEYAKLLLGVLEIEGEYTGSKWYVDVRNNANTAKLMTGMTYTWTANVTREQAAQMTFNAMQYGGTTVQDGYMVDGSEELVFATYLEAYLIADTDTARVEPHYVTTGDLMSEFVEDYGTGYDLYGRPSTNYTYKDAENNEQTLYYAQSADFVYTNATLPATIKADLKGYYYNDVKVEATTAGLWNGAAIVSVDTADKVDLKTAAGIDATEITLSEALAKLTDANAVVEIFTNADKVIEAIVITNTQFGQVTSVIEADEVAGTPELIVVDTDYVAVNAGFAQGDYVTYTIFVDEEDNGYAENVAAAEYIVGTLTSYTSTETYTINGTVYTLAGDAVGQASTIKTKFGTEYAYYLGANNTIVFAGTVPGGEEDPVLTDYAMILDSDAAVELSVGTWMGSSSIVVNSVVAQVKVLTAEGTVAVYDLTVTKAAAAISGTAVAKGDYYVVIDEAYVVLVDASALNAESTSAAATSTAQSALSGALDVDAVYTYAVEENVITLADTLAVIDGEEAESVVAVDTLDSTIDKTSTTLNTVTAENVIINENTIFVLKDTPLVGAAAIVVKTGAAALESTDDLTAGVVIADVIVPEEGDTIYVAKYVIAADVEFDATTAPAETVEDVVLIDGTYTITKVNGSNVYTYTAINAKGEVISLVGTSGLSAGLYTYNEDGEIEDQVDNSLVLTGVISGTTAKLGSDYLVVNDATVVVDLTGEGFETGCYVLYVLTVDALGNPTNVVSHIFVVVAAE